MHRFVRICGIAALIAGAGSCTDSTGPATLPQARALWDAQGFTSYVYTGTVTCFCAQPQGPVQVEVVNGQVVDVVDPVTGVRYATAGWPTVNDLFAMAETRAAVRLEFDNRLGYPTVVEFCCLANDSGIRYHLESLRPAIAIN